jgi:hypothetical protein
MVSTFAVAFLVAGIYLFGLSRATSPLPQPVNVSVNAAGTNKVALVWSPEAATGFTGYAVYRNGTQIATTDAYTANYLDTGRTAGSSYSYTVRALGGALSYPLSAPLVVTTATSAQVISACSDTPLPVGHYRLTANLVTSSRSGCLTFANGDGLTLDCQNHSLSSSWPGAEPVNMGDETHFMMVNCVFASPQSNSNNFVLYTSSNGTLENNTFTNASTAAAISGVSWTSSPYMVLNGNTLTNAGVSVISSDNEYIGHNKIVQTIPTGYSLGLVDIHGGNNSIVDANTLTGAGSATDDGVIMGDRGGPTLLSAEVVVNNTISNVDDAGVETAGMVEYSTIDNNKITGARLAAISSYHNTSWLGNKVIGNTASKSGNMFEFTEEDAQYPAGQSQFTFTNNAFANNTFDPTGLPPYAYTSTINLTPPSGLVLAAQNDVFSGNDLGHYVVTPYFSPASAFVGRDNICVFPPPAMPSYNVTCN